MKFIGVPLKCLAREEAYKLFIEHMSSGRLPCITFNEGPYTWTPGAYYYIMSRHSQLCFKMHYYEVLF